MVSRSSGNVNPKRIYWPQSGLIETFLLETFGIKAFINATLMPQLIQSRETGLFNGI